MHGVSTDLPLERFVGHEFNFVGLGRFQLQFHISEVGALHVEGRWELRDASGTLVDSDQEHAERDAYRMHRVIDTPITRFSLDAPRSFSLFFESGHSLTVYDASEQYESFAIHFTGEPSLSVYV